MNEWGRRRTIKKLDSTREKSERAAHLVVGVIDQNDYYIIIIRKIESSCIIITYIYNIVYTTNISSFFSLYSRTKTTINLIGVYNRIRRGKKRAYGFSMYILDLDAAAAMTTRWGSIMKIWCRCVDVVMMI